ncbi:putative dual-specificity RNA methyltransferase RlmN [Frankia canadensis]|uniref:Probable dual-specificity RNA methyltransferase RlmN n=1 Tax=Frankia canadensis TaxID=1836972 RepID=A0A2I2L241_9ACTN|nr:23S rRNA (adenine(2503)-C(2))-methyltransferase RlmN [Frankia canadensis]SNQ51982.1 putative dual-specificity RNA methyltransferase RlmN [Frankia canadensis]SOU59272.1 putative dual-specificity RNA methyltransferase RlmN [Frankia canadensis]
MTPTTAESVSADGPAPAGAGRPVRLSLTRRAARPAPHLADLSVAERRQVAVSLGQPAFRADQLSRHYFARLVDAAGGEAMTDLPDRIREPLVAALLPPLLAPAATVGCDDGQTRKTAWRTPDGALLESVIMRYPDRATVCVSSQAGCGMGCPFCATGQGGLTRNLSTAEIVEQVVHAARALRRGELGSGEVRLSNVVFMGMGEPLANYGAVTAALRRLIAPPPEGLGLSARGLTVSTVGLVPAMRRLAAEGLPVTLAVSLHAPDDELRDELVPVNNRWPIAEVLAAAWEYAERTGRRVSIEYALIDGVNDDPARADALATLLAGRLAHVNLIPLNPTAGSSWQASAPAGQRVFVRRLRERGIATTVRDTRGREIAAACGQLAAEPRERGGPARPVDAAPDGSRVLR